MSAKVSGRDQRRIGVENDDVALGASIRRGGLPDGVAGAKTVDLPRHACVGGDPGHLGLHGLVVGADDDGDVSESDGQSGAEDVADDGKTADGVQNLGRCRSHAGTFTRRQNDRQQFGHYRPVFHARFDRILWQERVGKPLRRRDGKLVRARDSKACGGAKVWRNRSINSGHRTSHSGAFSRLSPGPSRFSGRTCRRSSPAESWAGLHASRLDGASFNQLRGQVCGRSKPRRRGCSRTTPC